MGAYVTELTESLGNGSAEWHQGKYPRGIVMVTDSPSGTAEPLACGNCAGTEPRVSVRRLRVGVCTRACARERVCASAFVLPF